MENPEFDTTPEHSSDPASQYGTQVSPPLQQPSEIPPSLSGMTQQPTSHQATISPVTYGTLQMQLLGSLAAAVLLLLVFAFARRKTAIKGSAVLLTGPSDAGKTAIHSALVYEQVLPSHTSLQINTSFFTLPSSEKHPRTALLIDVPGHPRIRDQFKDHIHNAKAVVFVVDTSTVARNGAAVAEHLHHILHALTSLPPSQSLPSLVILAHKYDLLPTSSSSAALAVSRVRTILERELEKRRVSQASGVGVGQLGEDETYAELGGLECAGRGGEFKFKDWEGGEVEILSSSAQVGQRNHDDKKALDGLGEFKQWLGDLR